MVSPRATPAEVKGMGLTCSNGYIWDKECRNWQATIDYQSGTTVGMILHGSPSKDLSAVDEAVCFHEIHHVKCGASQPGIIGT